MAEEQKQFYSMTERGELCSIRDMIHIVRGQQILLDSDLAAMYGVETKVFNQAVKRNNERFPEEFRFQLTKEEMNDLRSQFVTSNAGAGGRRYLPYAFTESGVAMLSTVLRSDAAVHVSIQIMKAFVEMRHFVANNAALFERIRSTELQQLEYQRQTDERFARVFQYIENHAEPNQKVFYDGQIYDAFSLLISLIQKAQQRILLVDAYVDVGTLNILSKKNPGVNVTIYTFHNTRLTPGDIATFNAQYPSLEVRCMTAFHDRFLILDGMMGYHVGASLKDAGKKCFGINEIQDQQTIREIVNRVTR